ncbi:MAG: calcium/sodium antiporter [Alphaproteobacteria bacterium]
MALNILLGLILLAAGGDILVRGAVRLAEFFRVSRLVTGLVLVGFGTSLPEMATSVDAALKGSPGIAVGNVVGSNIANILLILGIAAILMPLRCDRRAFRRDGPMLAGATAAVMAVALGGEIGRLAGALFLAALALYVTAVYRIERRLHDASARLHEGEATLMDVPQLPIPERIRPWPGAGMALAGLGLIIWGADLMVSGSVELARALGVSETVIGLSIVAVGTSLPELATSVIAVVKREADIAVGNVMGSNIFNLLGILGVTALVRPIAVPREFLDYDWWILAGVTALLLVFAHTGSRLSRAEGGIFLGGYALFLGLLVYRSIVQ